MTERMGGADPVDVDEVMRHADFQDGSDISVLRQDSFDLRGGKGLVGPGTENGPAKLDETEVAARNVRRERGVAELL